MSTLDDSIFQAMTPEELAAIQDSDYSEDELQAMQKVVADASDEDEDDTDDGEFDNPEDGENSDTDADDAGDRGGAEDDASTGQDEEPADSEEEPSDTKQPEADTRRQLAAQYEASLPSDYDDQIKSLKSQDAEIRQRFKDGEIDIDERDDELSKLAEQREQLLVQRAKAEISQEMTQQTAAQQWRNTVDNFVSSVAKGDGAIDYRKDNAKAADLDDFVKFLAGKQENSDKSMEWFLVEAHKRVMALHGISSKPKSSAAQSVAEAVGKRKPPVDAVPKTLAQVPGSDGPGDVDGEFADVEALDGLELEDAIARMSPAQREKFVRGR